MTQKPNPPVTFEFESSYPDGQQLPLLPMLAALEQIKRDGGQSAEYNLTEWRHPKLDGMDVGIHLWLWPHNITQKPRRVWISADGSVGLDEEVDWLGLDEWPQHIIDTAEEHHHDN